MSAGLIKEILLDYGVNKLSVETAADIDLAVQHLYYGGVFSKHDLYILHSYISGFNAEEIGEMYRQSTNEVETRLGEIVEAIGEQLKVSDTQLINFARRNQYPLSKMESFKVFLQEHGRQYRQHEVPNAYGRERI